MKFMRAILVLSVVWVMIAASVIRFSGSNNLLELDAHAATVLQMPTMKSSKHSARVDKYAKYFMTHELPTKEFSYSNTMLKIRQHQSSTEGATFGAEMRALSAETFKNQFGAKDYDCGYYQTKMDQSGDQAIFIERFKYGTDTNRKSSSYYMVAIPFENEGYFGILVGEKIYGDPAKYPVKFISQSVPKADVFRNIVI